MTNCSLLTATLAAIKANPSTWYQGDWYMDTDCGTAMCFAGHAAILAGAGLPPVDNRAWFIDPETGETADSWNDPDAVTVSRYAQDKLGISHDQASALFYGNNTLEDLEAMIEAIKNGDDEELETLLGESMKRWEA